MTRPILKQQLLHYGVVVVLLLLSTHHPSTVVMAREACHGGCFNNNNTPWISDSKNQKCNWKGCGGCPKCPIKLYECPPATSIEPFPLPSNGQTIRLSKTEHTGELCTLTLLTKKTSSDELLRQPAGRSYDGHDWENVAGDFTHTLVFHSCTKHYCSVTLPPLKKDIDVSYFQLMRFNNNNKIINKRQLLSRFLTQSTFGPTRQSLSSLLNDHRPSLDITTTMALWIQKQHTMPHNLNSDDDDAGRLTSHRHYFRKRIIETRLTSPIDIGMPSHPCDSYSRWARFAFFGMEKHKEIVVTTVIISRPSIRPPLYRLVIDGIPRTEVANLDVISSGGSKAMRKKITSLRINQSYKICKSPIERVGGTLKVIVEGYGCQRLSIGNPPVEFPSGYIPYPKLEFGKGSLMSVASMVDDVMGVNRDMLMKKRGGDERSCRHDETMTWPTFALLSKDDGGDDEWLIHDPRLVLLSNIPRNRKAAEESSDRGGGDDSTICVNVPRTYANEKSCQLASSPICTPTSSTTTTATRLSCGSPGEVPNDLSIETGYRLSIDGGRSNNTIHPDYIIEQRSSVWTMIALYSHDELRQKMAWALSQIFAVNPGEFVGGKWSVEPFLNYYDIFVRGAFGSFEKVVKEVAYSPIIGEFLSYLNSRSTAYHHLHSNTILHPDENFARELLQLFTIGPIKLLTSGIPHLLNSKPIPTYQNDIHLPSFARSWTGFVRQPRRGNIEDHRNWNKIDPMRIDIDGRDVFPKRSLDDEGGYIGDGYPICAELPVRSHLRRGAMYRLLGDTDGSGNGITIVLTLERGVSYLYNALCQIRNDNSCSFKSLVTLEDNLPCQTNVECSIESNIPTGAVVRVDNVFYEYIERPCVELSFFDNGRILSSQHWNEGLTMEGAASACADPNVPMTAPPVSPQHNEKQHGFQWSTTHCNILIKVNQEGMISIVHSSDDVDDSLILRHLSKQSPNDFHIIWRNNNNYPHPTKNRCGNGACHTITNDNKDNNSSYCLCHTTVTKKLLWTSPDQIPLTTLEFLSKVHVGSVAPDVFDDVDYHSPFLLRDLKIYFTNRSGGTFDYDTIFQVTVLGETKYYKNKQSIVSIKHAATGETISLYSFRNPPHFLNFIYNHVQKAHDETDAVISNIVHHPNTAPFVSKQLIQRFGISNPSPRYVKAVAIAFRLGIYEYGDEKIFFGTKKYGDLAATSAAILLDREMRSATLDDDPFHGSLKEPFLKLVGFMRAMEFKVHRSQPEIMFRPEVGGKIGQMAHKSLSVFSFFLPDYVPPGVVARSSGGGELVSPEAMIHVTPYIVGLLNGMFSLVKYGMGDCHGGFGGVIRHTKSDMLNEKNNHYNYGGNKPWKRPITMIKSLDKTKKPKKEKKKNNKKNKNKRLCIEGTHDRFGKLSYTPSDDSSPRTVVNELAMLLTAGRLNPSSRRKIEDAYAQAQTKDEGLRLAQQLFLATPEFNTNHNRVTFNGKRRNVNQRQETIKTAPSSSSSPSPRYKAVVFLMLKGGVDSYNILMPHSGCDNTRHDLRREYNEIRGSLAIKNDELVIDATAQGEQQQPCRQFFLHPSIPYIKTLYDERDLLFFANAGILPQPHLNKDNYKDVINGIFGFFAHNIQSKSVQDIDNYSKSGSGVLGRTIDVLARTRKNKNIEAVSLRCPSYALVGGNDGEATTTSSPPIVYLDYPGVDVFNQKPSSKDMPSLIEELNAATDFADNGNSGIFAETWSETLLNSIADNEFLAERLGKVKAHTQFPQTTDLGRQFEVVSRMMQIREERDVDRDVFYVEYDGWDTHNNQGEKLNEKLTDTNEAIQHFVSEMKHLDLWKDVVVIEVSEFGRTLTPNSGTGSDHGWGGNYFVMGGEIRGGRILGQYPDDLTPEGSLITDRGRVIPTTAWEEIWNGVIEWFGVKKGIDLDEVLPNRGEFQNLYTVKDIFGDDS